MRLNHIYITKEGEPMANPEMEYPETPNYYANEDHSDMPQEYQDSMDIQLRMGYEVRVKQYHSGLLPFEDIQEAKDNLPKKAWIEWSDELKKDTLIPVDLEVEVVNVGGIFVRANVLRIKP